MEGPDLFKNTCVVVSMEQLGKIVAVRREVARMHLRTGVECCMWPLGDAIFGTLEPSKVTINRYVYTLSIPHFTLYTL